jgi:thiol-disulfide isomerase/thioredoxin
MIFGKQSRPRAATLWTTTRLALTLFAVSLLALVASNCAYEPASNSNGTTTPAATNGNAPSVTVKTAPGSSTGAPGASVTTAPDATTGANPSAPPTADMLPIVPEAVSNMEIQALAGKGFRLADYKGKVLVLDLWATWCGPCRDEIPHLVALSKEYAPKGVEVVGLTTEEPGVAEDKVQEFVKQFSISYKIGWSKHDLSLALMNGNGSIPQTFVLTRGGRVLKRFVGFSPVRSPEMLRQAIETALKMPAGA